MNQPIRLPKVRWNGFLTTENFDWICRIAHDEDLSLASVINRILKEKRLNGESNVVKSTKTLQSHEY